MKQLSLICLSMMALMPFAARDARAQSASSAVTGTAADQLEEVVVTAQKTAEDSQKVPVAMSTLSSRQLDNAGITDMVAIGATVPDLHVVDQGPALAIFFRGVGSNILTAQGEPDIALYADGVYMARPNAQDGLFYDLDRIEVLKGPQGTLYGRNATVGAVNVITNQPSDHFEASGEIEGGDYSLLRTEGMVNVPLSDSLWVRAAFQTLHHDGYMTDGYDDADDTAGRLRVLFQPNSDFSALITGDYFQKKGSGQGTVALGTPTAGANYPIFENPSNPWQGDEQAGDTDIKNSGVTAEIKWNLGPATLSVQPAYRYTNSDNKGYSSGISEGINNLLDSNASSLEVHLASNFGAPMQWIVGAYYSEENINEESTLFNLPFCGPGCSFDSTTSLPDLHHQIDAAFGQLTYSIRDWLRVTGGLRYTSDDTNQTGEGYSTFPGDFVTGVFPITGDVSQHKLTWKAGLEADVAPQSLVYLNVSTGFKAGGLNPELPPNVFVPELLTEYAIGSKNRFLDNRLQLNAEIFYWGYSGEQFSQFTAVNAPPGVFAEGVLAFNAGKSTIYGTDADVAYLLTENDRFGVSLSYLHGTYDNAGANQALPNGNGGAVSLAGQTLPYSPKWSGTFGYQHTFRLPAGATLTPAVDTQFQTQSYDNYLLQSWAHQQSFTKTNLTARYALSGDRFWFTGTYGMWRIVP